MSSTVPSSPTGVNVDGTGSGGGGGGGGGFGVLDLELTLASRGSLVMILKLKDLVRSP